MKVVSVGHPKLNIMNESRFFLEQIYSFLQNYQFFLKKTVICNLRYQPGTTFVIPVVLELGAK